MTRLANVTKFPHATGEARMGLPAKSAAEAFKNAVTMFLIEYNRPPDYDILRFRGCTSTTTVVCEIWEEG